MAAGSLEFAAGQRVGEYELLDEIGAGGFSVVWRARHAQVGSIVALKFPRVPEFVEHLRREAHISMRFEDPQVVGILDVRLDGPLPYLVMPYVAGRSLELPDGPAPPVKIVDALRRFRQVVEVMARLHEAGIVHGDLSPGNIRVDEEGVIHLLDLGLARQQLQTRQLSTLRASVVSVTGKSIAGTLEYMAPELQAGGKPDRAADVYALGVILHHLLCGQPPAFGVTPRGLNPFLPPGSEEFLRSLLDPDPLLRLHPADALLSPVDGFIRAEERCLRRRNGHQRRLVFRERMRTLARGFRAVTIGLALGLGIFVGLPLLPPIQFEIRSPKAVQVFLFFAAYSLGWLALVLGVTTINAWALGIPEKTYKQRRGHPLWNFMMQ